MVPNNLRLVANTYSSSRQCNNVIPMDIKLQLNRAILNQVSPNNQRVSHSKINRCFSSSSSNTTINYGNSYGKTKIYNSRCSINSSNCNSR